MALTPLEKLDRKIQETDRKLVSLNALRSAMVDGVLADEVEEIFSLEDKPHLGKPAQRKSKQRKSKQMEKIAGFYEASGNEYATIADIQKKTGFTKASVRQILYKSRPDEFVRQKASGAGRPTFFKLKNYST